jgi:phospholipid/cholesterol/gamma-HCH transport system substrate-binding protein
MKAFSERNPFWIGLIGLIVLASVFFLTFNASSLPIIGGGTTYHARFAEAAGLSEGDEVRIAGVKVGKVTDITLAGDTVDVEFKVKDAWIGDQSVAAIKIKTMLGQKFLSVDPQGSEELEAGKTITHTTTPYDVTLALGDLSKKVDAINTPQLEKSFRVLADTFRDTPKSVRQMVDGLSRLSHTVASRDQELATLLDATSEISGTLKTRNGDIEALLRDGNLLLTELDNRRESIRALLRGTERLAVQVEGLVADNKDSLRPALDNLSRVTEILQANERHINSALKMVGSYYSVLASASGDGPWIDSYVCGLFDANHRPQLDAEVKRNCDPKKGGGR